ncbi:VirB4 family type IV secretion system protein [Stagnihabitans tardus]|uniref:Type IV secretion system DNA-binding domain-containing protein n=1 Tax=Stagnihabitans tardus TaxID=2699202 RepID=A0AAE5BTM7_9RHOB|nr:type IV secretion system DNA-binding domain-containing protein [Stagnihabitans tardus]NBZ89210.1 type IV secretion system DNA-binding domain-containing protein [Stagnihabitans tardus]
MEVDDEVVRTRENALMLSLEVTGVDGITSGDAATAGLRAGFAHLLDTLDERFTFYLHRMMRPAETGLTPVHGSGFAAEIDRAWGCELARRNLQEPVLILTVVRAQVAPLAVPLFARAASTLWGEDTARRLEELREVVSILETGLGVQSKRLKMSDGSLVGFYASLSTGELRAAPRNPWCLIAEDAAGASIRFEPGRVQIEEGTTSPRVAAVLYVKSYATATWPGMLDALGSSQDTIITHSYTPIERASIAERVKRRVAQMRAADDIAATVETQLFEAADKAESGALGFGTHQMTITVFAESSAALDAEVARIRGIAHQNGMRLVREVTALEAGFFAMHPGNMDYRARDMVISSLNFADMAALHAADTGTEPARLPWGTPITLFQTLQGSLHRFSFHEPGDPKAEPTNGHTLFLGKSGGGKTTTAAFLMAQAQRAGGRTIIFDKEAGLKMAVQALGGRYAELRAGRPTGLNPLATETGERGEAWTLDWLVALLEQKAAPLTPLQSEALKSAIAQNAKAGNSLRNFRAFQELFGDVGDGLDLARRVSEWGPDGRYAWVFGAAKEPVVDFASHDVTAVDLTEILDLGTERTAILAYLFRRIEMLIEERRPTLIVIDEAWKVLDDDYFGKKLAEWLVTARKKNVVVVMMTQFPSQIRGSRARSILEALPNQLIFPNGEAARADYEGFRLTGGEIDFVLNPIPGQRLALSRSPRGSTVLNVDLKALGPLLTALGGGQAGVNAFGADYAQRASFWRG